MRILASLILLSLISCGDKSGDGTGVRSGPTATNPSYVYGQASGYETLEKFKSAVAKNQWAQYPEFLKNYHYKFNFGQATNDCKSWNNSFFTFKVCNPQNSSSPIKTSEEKNGVSTNLLIDLNRIKEIVKQSSEKNCFYNPNYYYNYNHFYNRWIIVIDHETFVFDPGFPLSANPLYYKNTKTGEEYTMYKYSGDPIPTQ